MIQVGIHCMVDRASICMAKLKHGHAPRNLLLLFFITSNDSIKIKQKKDIY